MKEARKSKYYHKAGKADRLQHLAVFAACCTIFVLLLLVAKGNINLSRFGQCAFQRNCTLPCPTCGMSRAITAFMNGRTITAFCLQPAAVIGCLAIAAAGFFSGLAALLGINFWFLPPIRFWPLGKLLFAAAVLLAAGWLSEIIKTIIAEN